jgi:non-specific serine/threonine protein kinase
MAADVFVSYARKDRERVVGWIRSLQSTGISVWVDEQAIEGAVRWGQMITEAIEQCQAVLLMLSPASAASEHVLREVFLALDEKKPILPLFLEPVPIPAGLRYALAGIQHLNLSAEVSDEKLQAILRALSGLGVPAQLPETRDRREALISEPAATGLLPRAPESERPSAGSPAPPPLPPPETTANNLPRQLTSFIGRERETAELNERLKTSRLVTLVGPGGCGKTRLALQVAGSLLPEFVDGVWMVELEAIPDPSLVIQTVAAALGVREEPGRPLAAMLADFLQSRSILLFLDNCEHVIQPCAQLAESLLRTCQNLRILTTSREALGVRGEALQRVSSLSLPSRKLLQAPGPDLASTLMRYGAVELFVARASAASASFALTDQNARGVAQVCRRLDGIPLALELAAARVRVLSVEQIAQRLDDRFRLLTGGSRTALPRQQTLRATIEWSYELLGEPERVLLRRLSLFAGGWEMAAAEAICAGEALEEWEVLDYLTQLVDKSLVDVEALQTGQIRYTLLESVHQYGLEKLRESGEEEIMRAQHSRCFRRLAEEAQPHLHGSEQALWVDRLETEHDNLRAALEWTLASGRTEEAAATCVALTEFWWQRGWIQEGRDALARCLARENDLQDDALRAALLGAAGWGAQLQAHFEEASGYQERSLALCRQLGGREGEANALNNLALTAQAQGRLPEARELFESSLVLVRGLGDAVREAARLSNLGLLAIHTGEYDSARERLIEAQAIYERCHDIHGSAACLCNLAELALRREEWEEAEALSQRGVELFRRLEDRVGIALTLANLAEAVLHRAECAVVEQCLREALSICAQIGMRGLVPALLELRGRNQAACGAAREGLFCLTAALRLRGELCAPRLAEEQKALEAVEADLLSVLGNETATAIRSQVAGLPRERLVEEALKQGEP